MKKSVLGFTIAGALLIGGYATTSLANDDTTASSSVSSKLSFIGKGFGHKGFFGGNSEELIAKAKDLGISTTGKDAETLMGEIREVTFKSEAKKLGIKTANKDIDTLAEEVQLAKLKETAKDLGISTDGKDAEALLDAIRLANLQKEAKEL